ncbi:MAG: beta-galactosidase [Saccharofermentanales bacterium]
MREDPGVIEARVRTVGGLPRLFIDGQAVAPVMFSALYGYGEGEAIQSQIRKAGNNQTDIVRIVISIMGSIAEDMGKYVDSAIDMVLANNPDAMILLTYGVYDNPSRLKGGSAEFDAFKDQYGTMHTFSSLTSRAWLQQYKESTQALVEYVISNPKYADKVIGYQPAAGSAGEWFGPMYFEGLADCSESNNARFREFLAEKYKNISALRSAWGDGSLDFDTITVPVNIPGSGLGEIRNPLDYTIIITPENQKYTDYEDHYSAVLADAIAQICEVIKETSDGRSIAMSYFGYHSEVRTPFSGSFGLYKLLDCEYIDALSAPVSYNDRNSGGIGAFMSPVNSIHHAGKLWFDECDYRTPNRTSDGFFPGGTQESVSFMPEIATIEDASGVLKRQAGKAMVFGSGYWWLDLIYRGWFDYDEFWEENNELQKLYIDYMKYKTGEAPAVAIVYDERAFNMLGQPWQIGSDLLADMRGMLYTA